MLRLTFETILVTMIGVSGACNSADPIPPNDLDVLGTETLKIDSHEFRSWIADDDQERQKGLMFVTADEMAPLPDGTERGMLFVFPRDEMNGFWMRNTIIDLDIAFIDKDRKVISVMTMRALDESSYRPSSAYRYALEVRSGVFGRLGIEAGDVVQIPPDALKQPR